MKKKGFTLIEIIVCVALISIVGVGTIVGVKVHRNKSLEKFYSQFDKALEVYLSTHSDVYKNLNDNVDGAVITLEVLKNEGLIKEGIKHPETEEVLDYRKNYYVLSDAIEGEEGLESEEISDYCDNQVQIKVMTSWDLSKISESDKGVIYICPKEGNSTSEKTIIETKEVVSKMEERIKSLEYALSLMNLGGNNYILFDVASDSSEETSWNTDEKNEDLWGLVNLSGRKIKLLYASYLINDNTKTLKYGEVQYYTPKHPCDEMSTKSSIKGSSKWNPADFKYIDTFKTSFAKPSIYIGRNVLEYNNKYYYYEKSSDVYGETYYCDVDKVVSGPIYIKNKKDEVTNDEDNNIFTIYEKNDEWAIHEIIKENYETENSKKKILYEHINANLKDKIMSTEYKYQYTPNASNDMYIFDAPNLNSAYFTDKLGLLTTNDQYDNITEILIGKSFFVGTFSANYSTKAAEGYVEINNGKANGYNSSYEDFIKSFNILDGEVREYQTVPYIPVITIDNVDLMQDYAYYPISYKDNEKYKSCSTDKLGTKDCPYLLKVGEYYSNGEKIS